MTAAKKKVDEDADQEAKAEEAEAPAVLEENFRSAVTGEFVTEAEAEANPDTTVKEQSHSSYLPNFVPLEGSAISDHVGAQFEYHKSLRDIDKQIAANDGGYSFDAGGEEAEARLQEKLDFLAEEEVFARTFPGSGGHDVESSRAAQEAQTVVNAQAVKDSAVAAQAVAVAAQAARDGD